MTQLTKAEKVDMIEAQLKMSPPLGFRCIAKNCHVSWDLVKDVASALGIVRKGHTSADVRAKVLVILETTTRTLPDIGKEFGLCESTVQRVWRKAHPNEKRDAKYLVRKLLAVNPNLTNAQLQEMTALCRSQINNALKTMNLVEIRGPRRPKGECRRLVDSCPAHWSAVHVAMKTGVSEVTVRRIRRAKRVEQNG